MAEKKKSSRKQYLDQFVKKEDGSYEYTGPRYIPVNAAWKRVSRMLYLYLAAAAVCLIGAGFVPSSGMISAWYVIVPYAAAVLMTILLAVRMLRVTADKGTIHTYTYDRTVAWFSIDALIIMGFNAVSCYKYMESEKKHGREEKEFPETVSGSVCKERRWFL